MKGSNEHRGTIDVEMLMQRFYNLRGSKSKRVSTHISRQDQEHYIHRVVEYRELGDKIKQLDPLADHSLINAYGYKRSVIWNEFNELANKMAKINNEE